MPWPKREVAPDAARARRSARRPRTRARRGSPRPRRAAPARPAGIVDAVQRRRRARASAAAPAPATRSAASPRSRPGAAPGPRPGARAASGCSRQQHGAVRDQVRGGVVAGDDQHEAEAEQLLLREALAVDLGVEQRAHQVVAALAAALVEQPRELAVDVRRRAARALGCSCRRGEPRPSPRSSARNASRRSGGHADHARRSRGSAGGARTPPAGPPRPAPAKPSSSSRAIARMRGSIAATRRGVKARETSSRSASWRGGSMRLDVGRRPGLSRCPRRRRSPGRSRPRARPRSARAPRRRSGFR